MPIDSPNSRKELAKTQGFFSRIFGLREEPPPPKYKCSVHGEHGLFLAVFAGGPTPKRYCIHCITEMFDRQGVEQACFQEQDMGKAKDEGR